MLIGNDTIVAIATSHGKSGIGIIRISGSKAFRIGKLVTKISLISRKVHFASFYSVQNEIIDQGVALYFKAPQSYTGEDIIELQAHGNPFLLDILLKVVTSYGARLAKPGEFTERAYLNGKIDLAQAESVCDIINASSQQAVKSALRSLQGTFSTQIHSLVKELIALRVNIEASIDFSGEDVTIISDIRVQKTINRLMDQIKVILVNSKKLISINNGINIMIVGEPNVGKSSLFNRILGKDAAIVTQIKGTTRDLLSEDININGIPVTIMDTAGLRETKNIVEKKGIERTLNGLSRVDHVLLVFDIYAKEKDVIQNVENLSKYYSDNTTLTLIFNKIDLESKNYKNSKNRFYISIKNNTGIEDLNRYLFNLLRYEQFDESLATGRERHIIALNNTLKILKKTKNITLDQYEILAEELYLAQKTLSSITGEFTSDDLLGDIFSTFCIGK